MMVHLIQSAWSRILLHLHNDRTWARARRTCLTAFEAPSCTDVINRHYSSDWLRLDAAELVAKLVYYGPDRALRAQISRLASSPERLETTMALAFTHFCLTYAQHRNTALMCDRLVMLLNHNPLEHVAEQIVTRLYHVEALQAETPRERCAVRTALKQAYGARYERTMFTMIFTHRALTNYRASQFKLWLRWALLSGTVSADALCVNGPTLFNALINTERFELKFNADDERAARMIFEATLPFAQRCEMVRAAMSWAAMPLSLSDRLKRRPLVCWCADTIRETGEDPFNYTYPSLAFVIELYVSKCKVTKHNARQCIRALIAIPGTFRYLYDSVVQRLCQSIGADYWESVVRWQRRGQIASIPEQLLKAHAAYERSRSRKRKRTD